MHFSTIQQYNNYPKFITPSNKEIVTTNYNIIENEKVPLSNKDKKILYYAAGSALAIATLGILLKKSGKKSKAQISFDELYKEAIKNRENSIKNPKTGDTHYFMYFEDKLSSETVVNSSNQMIRLKEFASDGERICKQQCFNPENSLMIREIFYNNCIENKNKITSEVIYDNNTGKMLREIVYSVNDNCKAEERIYDITSGNVIRRIYYKENNLIFSIKDYDRKSGTVLKSTTYHDNDEVTKVFTDGKETRVIYYINHGNTKQSEHIFDNDTLIEKIEYNLDGSILYKKTYDPITGNEVNPIS